jgi:photosystem II stability/assembly factor-like uncharacterized protein
LTSVHDVDFTSLEQGWAVGEAINYGDFLVHTTDGGKSWAQVYPIIRPIRDISFVDNLHGFGLWQLSDLGALLYTDDGGKSWSKIMNFPLDYNTSRISFVDRKNGWCWLSR